MIKHSPLIDNTDTAFLGIVSSDSLFTGQQLSDTMGITEGTLYNNDCGWLHFYVGENASCNRPRKPYEIFISKKTLRYGISWNHINSENGVEGKDVVANNGREYTCRLLTGKKSADSLDGMGSEWDSLIYRVHNDCVDNWVNMTNKDLGMQYPIMPGAFTWCQEYINTVTRVIRGGDNVSTYTTGIYTSPYLDTGWRPVLIRQL